MDTEDTKTLSHIIILILPFDSQDEHWLSSDAEQTFQPSTDLNRKPAKRIERANIWGVSNLVAKLRWTHDSTQWCVHLSRSNKIVQLFTWDWSLGQWKADFDSATMLWSSWNVRPTTTFVFLREPIWLSHIRPLRWLIHRQTNWCIWCFSRTNNFTPEGLNKFGSTPHHTLDKSQTTLELKESEFI